MITLTILNDMAIHQKKDRRSQILSSIQDTEQALTGNIGEDTRNYLSGYLQELQRELEELGLN